MLTLNLSKELTREPFKTLLLSQIESIELETLGAKTEFLQHLVDSLSSLENDTENQTTALHWTGVCTGFSTAATIAGIGALNPVLGFFVGTISAVSAIGTVGLSIVQNYKMAPILETLRRSRIALNNDEAINWAAIWHIGGTNCFIGAVKAAMTGTLSNDGTKLLRIDNKTSITVGVDYLARRYGLSREQAVDEIKKVKAGNPSKLPSLEPVSILALPEEKPKDSVTGALSGQSTKLQTEAPTVLGSNTPTVLQPEIPTIIQPSAIQPSGVPSFMAPLPSDSIDKTVMYQNALSAINYLVDKADQGIKGGCVILSVPGAGKTTFLGAAWGRLKQRYGSNFRSLAVVVKRTDVEAFRGVSDACLCVKDSPRETAITIIRFIDESMGHTGHVRRLFLDDFLTMQQYFDGLGTIHLNPITYRCYANKKDAVASDDLDAVLLSKVLKTRLNEGWLVGRQYNFSLYASSHSSNVEALPFCGSREARAVGDMIFLARNDKRDFIEHALNNSNLIGDANKRVILKRQLDEAQASDNEPLMLANFNNWTLGIVPAAVDKEYQDYRAGWEGNIDRQVQSLEAMFKAEPAKNVEPINEVDVEEEALVSSEAPSFLFADYTKEQIFYRLFHTTETSLNKFVKNDLKITNGAYCKAAKDAIKDYLKSDNLQMFIEKLDVDFED